MALQYLIIHSTLSPEGVNITTDEIAKKHKERGWGKTGYSDLINIDGTVSSMIKYNNSFKSYDWDLSYKGENINGSARHIAYVGGVNKGNNLIQDTRTDNQKESLKAYVKYMIMRHPDIKVAGHGQFTKKACPSFNVNKWLESIGVKKKNMLIFEQ
jgi:N-acetylmuramoyl-L-alanine amidase